MKVFKINGTHRTYFVCANHIEEAKELFSFYWYPIYGKDVLKERREECFTSGEFTIEECDLSHANVLGGHEG